MNSNQASEVPGHEAVQPSFDAVWADAQRVDGWLTRDQGRALWDAATSLTDTPTILEIGSHKGRSTIVLGNAARVLGARVVAVDPFIEGRLFGGVKTRQVFEQNIDRAGLADVIELRPVKSGDLRPSWSDPIDLLYIDGKHDYWTVRDDLRWSTFVVPGAPVLIHDSFSSIGVTGALLLHVLPGSSLRYLGRTGSLARFEHNRPSPTDRLRLLGEVPWWIRNVAIKIVLRVARLFGSTAPDPY